MRIESTYTNRYLIPKEYKHNFKRKNNISMLDKIALQEILIAFIAEYEEEITGETCTAEQRQELRDVIRWNDNGVDILDGYYNTYEFNGYLIEDVWTTENGIPCMTVYEIPEDCDDWTEHDCRSDFSPRIFRLY